ncbi:MAG TPA: hypothetical protein VFT03_05360 [Rubrobacteraceae bacterium]|nr:hypothetical protein [Rubrobacteraceae bacterium]
MRRSAGSTIDPGVFWVSLGISMLFVVWGVFFTDNLSAIIFAAPFVLVMICMCYSLFKELREERVARPAPEPERAAGRMTGAPAPQQSSSLEREAGG